ncbi:MAG: polyprenyl diphosphate synthase [Thiovulaceae bacterium]|nr:polyprenyl diphosphate synthase [Sulfurimonadaceae bacterium]
MNQAKHIAIIMDGNGRWAKARGLKRTKGHEAGAQVIREISEFVAAQEEIDYLTLYAFSTENWKRPKTEVNYLMALLEKYLEDEKKTFLDNNIKFQAIGDRSAFSVALQKKISELETLTKDGTALTHSLALNYGGRDEIVRSVKRLIQADKNISEENIQASLDLPTDIDLLIRTGGDHRISNFLLWQASYAELFFTETLWPDFNDDEMKAILHSFSSIERRFGGVK